MAPEIVKYNGEEEYTEKVDCFSFGMFIYELLTLQQPFAGYETVKELILEGGRPPLTSRELIYPTYLLGTIHILRKHFCSTKLNLTSKFWQKLFFFVKT